MSLLQSQPPPSGYCFLRVSVRKPDGSVQDYVVDGQTTVRDFAIAVLGSQSGGSIQILEILTVPAGVTEVPLTTPTIRSNNEWPE